MLNEEWHMQMYDYMRAYSKNVVFFWIIIIITGEVIIMKLYLALFINNYLDVITKKGIIAVKDDEFYDND